MRQNLAREPAPSPTIAPTRRSNGTCTSAANASATKNSRTVMPDARTRGRPDRG